LYPKNKQVRLPRSEHLLLDPFLFAFKDF